MNSSVILQGKDKNEIRIENSASIFMRTKKKTQKNENARKNQNVENEDATKLRRIISRTKTQKKRKRRRKFLENCGEYCSVVVIC